MIIIIDNGSQYTHLIKRNCRDMDYQAEIINGKLSLGEYKDKLESAEKIILSGGPSSVNKEPADSMSSVVINKILEGEWKIPLLGICYGHQLIAHLAGGKVEKGESAEYGLSEVEIDNEDEILKNLPKKINVWVSHFDQITKLPETFIPLAHSKTCKVEAMKHVKLNVYGLQFHPEVWHTEHGEDILKNFLVL